MAKKHTVSETNETISAVITALGEGAVGIIRISGTEAAAIGDKLFRSASGKRLTEHTPHLLVYGHVVDEENSKIDEVLAFMELTQGLLPQWDPETNTLQPQECGLCIHECFSTYVLP